MGFIFLLYPSVGVRVIDLRCAAIRGVYFAELAEISQVEQAEVRVYSGCLYYGFL